MRRKIYQTTWLLLFFLWCFLIPGMAIGEGNSEMIISSGQTVYVPVYSHIYSGDREHPFLLAVTLSIRNTDPKHAITVMAVDYYDSKGKKLRSYLKEPIKLDPLASTRYVIKESDKSGGSGANFIVEWRSESQVNAPVIESVMIGTKTQQGISFISPGRVIGP
jgi:hypothetical protein